MAENVLVSMPKKNKQNQYRIVYFCCVHFGMNNSSQPKTVLELKETETATLLKAITVFLLLSIIIYHTIPIVMFGTEPRTLNIIPILFLNDVIFSFFQNSVFHHDYVRLCHTTLFLSIVTFV